MAEGHYIDVVWAHSVLEVAEVVAAVLGARLEMGGEPGRIVVTGAPDPDLRVVVGVANGDRGLPDRWTRRITIAHERSDAERRRWTQHLHRALTDRRDWTLTTPWGPSPHGVPSGRRGQTTGVPGCRVEFSEHRRGPKYRRRAARGVAERRLVAPVGSMAGPQRPVLSSSKRDTAVAAGARALQARCGSRVARFARGRSGYVRDRVCSRGGDRGARLLRRRGRAVVRRVRRPGAAADGHPDRATVPSRRERLRHAGRPESPRTGKCRAPTAAGRVDHRRRRRNVLRRCTQRRRHRHHPISAAHSVSDVLGRRCRPLSKLGRMDRDSPVPEISLPQRRDDVQDDGQETVQIDHRTHSKNRGREIVARRGSGTRRADGNARAGRPAKAGGAHLEEDGRPPRPDGGYRGSAAIPPRSCTGTIDLFTLMS